MKYTLLLSLFIVGCASTPSAPDAVKWSVVALLRAATGVNVSIGEPEYKFDQDVYRYTYGEKNFIYGTVEYFPQR